MAKEETQAAQVEEMAEFQFSPEEIEIITQLPEGSIATDKKYKLAFRRGRLRAQAEVRKSIVEMAKRGSSPAQKQFLQLVDESQNAMKQTEDTVEYTG